MINISKITLFIRGPIFWDVRQLFYIYNIKYVNYINIKMIILLIFFINNYINKINPNTKAELIVSHQSKLASYANIVWN